MDNAAIRESFASSIYMSGVGTTKEDVLASLPEELARKHREGDLHIHDLESFGRVYNCSTPDLYQYLDNQAYSCHSERGAIFEVFEKVKLLISSLANCQAGGIGFGNFDIDMGRFLAGMKISHSGDSVYALREAMMLFLDWINYTRTRFCRETYYLTLNVGLATDFWGRQVTAVLIDCFMHSPKSFTKPNIVFKVSDKINQNPGAINYDLYRQALACTARRMIPTYLLLNSAPNQNCDPYNLNIMGCRTRVYDNINGREGTIGRGNIAYVSINLPRIALLSSDMVDFYARLEKTMDICVRILKIRRDRLGETSGKHMEYVFANHIWRNSTDIDDMLLSGSYSIGFIGLSETVEVLTGAKFFADDGSYRLAQEIVGFMNRYVMQKRQEEHRNYSLLATPGEMLSGRFCHLDETFCPHSIQGKGFYTNSFHVEVDSMVSLFDKIRLEGVFHSLCTGGSITYVEFASAILENTEALADAVRYAEECGVSYLGINFPLDICNACGKDGTFDSCPYCGSNDILRLRRVSGYLENMAYFTDGKMAEAKRRKANMQGAQYGIISTCREL